MSTTQYECPKCKHEFEASMWDCGECPKCGNQYMWDAYTTNDDEWDFTVWQSWNDPDYEDFWDGEKQDNS